MGSSAVGSGDSILVPIVSPAMGAQGFRDDVPGSMAGIGEGMREGEASGGEGSYEAEYGATNTQAESEEITNPNSPTELAQ